MKKYYSAWTLIVVYITLSITMLFAWQQQNKSRVSGDEPNYLIVTYAICKYHTFEITQASQDNFDTGIIRPIKDYIPGTLPSSKNTDGKNASHGLFSVHNIGLPILLCIPFMIAGITGAKLCMIGLNSLLILFAWKISAIFSKQAKTRFIAVFMSCIGLPLLPASNQIFPDMLAGALVLGGIYWVMTMRYHRCITKEILGCIVIAFLPWLHIKFILCSTFFLLALCVTQYVYHKNVRRISLYCIIFLTSFFLLAMYNHYAFDQFSGPYVSGRALAYNKTSLMVFFGLFLDQNQGFILQNLVTLIGVAWLGMFYTQNKTLVLWLAIIFLSLLIPNALHHNWYGGHGFSGRFEWSASSVFVVVTLFGLIQFMNRLSKIKIIVLSTLACWQIYLFYRYAFQGLILYRRHEETPLADYSLFYGKISHWLPAFYNVNWAYQYLPNYAWLTFVLFIFFAGFVFNRANNKNF